MVLVYDWSTRAVYNETTSTSVRTMALNWASQARGKSKRIISQRNSGIGAPKLQAMALRSCVLNLELFSVDTLRSAQWHYAGKIYQECMYRQALSFNDWNLYNDAFPKNIKRYHHLNYARSYHKDSDLITREVPHIAGKLARLDIDSLSLLCLHNVCITFEHLVCLTKIPGLSGLFLDQRGSALPETVKPQHMKHWARTVREQHAFQRLEVLFMANFDIEVGETLHAIYPSSVVTRTGTWNQYSQHEQDHGRWSMAEGGSIPEDFWDFSKHKSTEQMRKLHTFSRYMRNIAEQSNASLGISYGDPSLHRGQSTVCYTRSEIDMPDKDLKRSLGEETKVERSAKKPRTLRARNQADIGSFLGQFT